MGNTILKNYKLLLPIAFVVVFTIFFVRFFMPFTQAKITNNFNVKIISEKHDLTEHEVIIEVQNLDRKNRNFDLGFFITKTSFNLSELKDVWIYEWKPILKTFHNYTYVNKTVYYPYSNYIIQLASINKTNQTFELPPNCWKDPKNSTHYACNVSVAIDNPYQAYELDWKPAKMQLIRHPDKVLADYGNIKIPKYNSKCEKDDFGNVYDCNGTKKFKIVWKTPISRLRSGWGSYGYYAIYDGLTNISYDPWWDTSWLYRRPINITEQSGNTLTNYQVRLEIDTATLISQGKMNSDCSDIRFTDENDNEIPYWIESGCNSANTIIWVKVPEIPASGTTTIYMYYGNLYATSETNPYSVFIIYDDFEDGVINTTIWNVTSGVQETDGYLYLPSGSDNYAKTVNEKSISVSNNIGIVLYMDYYVGHVTTWTPLFGTTTLQVQVDCANSGNYCGTPGNYFTLIRRTSEYYDFVRVSNTPGEGQIDHTGLHERGNWTFIIFSNSYKIYFNGDLKWSKSGVTVGSPFLVGGRQYGSPNNVQKFYEIRVRKYVDPEPTYEIGSEETSPNQPPEITIYSPQNTTYHTTNLQLKFKVTDDNSTSFHVKAYFENQLIYENTSYQNNTEITLNLQPYITETKTYYVKVWANDTDENYPSTGQKIVYFTVDNLPPMVNKPKTYDENLVEKTEFNINDKIVIRVNVTDVNPDVAMITIIDNSSKIMVNNSTMTKIYQRWWDTSWLYRRPINITEQSGNTLTDYQVAINITYDSNMQSDFSDIRFTWYNSSNYTETEIPYWIEDKVDSQWAYVWVKVPEIPANGNTTIYMYYGNTTPVSSKSNKTAVLDFFDDFSGTNLDSSKWDIKEQSGTQNIIEVTNGELHIYMDRDSGTGASSAEGTSSDSNTQASKIVSKVTLPTNVYIEFKARMRLIRAGTYGARGWFRITYMNRGSSNDGSYEPWTGTQTNTGISTFYLRKRESGTTTDLASYSADFNDYVYKIYAYNGNLKLCRNSDCHTNTFSPDPNYMRFEILGRNWDSGNIIEMYMDYVKVRKYVDPEPTYEIGSEESRTYNYTTPSYEYNYTISSDAVGGLWTINVYVNDTYNEFGYNTTTFEVVVLDTTPPTITFVSQTPSNINESTIEPVTIIINITDDSGVNLSKVAFFTGINHTLTLEFCHYNWSWRYPANDLQPDMRRADNRNMSYWFEDVVFKESPDDIWTFAGYDNSTYEFEVIDSGDDYYTINITFFSAQMMFPQVFPFDKMYLTAEDKTGQYIELYTDNWLKIKFYPKVFYNYTNENYTIYLDLNVDPSFTPNTKPLEIYFCNSSYTTGDPLDSDYCAYVEEIDATDTRTIVINQSSYIQNIFYIANGHIDGVKVTDEAYLVLRTTVPAAKAFRLYYADDEINEFINFSNFNHAWLSSDSGSTWTSISYTPDFYLISTQAERDKIMYYVYACDIYDNCANSSIQYDSLDPVNHAPAEPLIIKPEENENVTGLYNITWLTSGDPDFDPYNASVYLCNPDGSINATLADNNITGNNSVYRYYFEFNASEFPTGKYRVNVTLCDAHGLCSSSLTAYNFTIYHVFNRTLNQTVQINETFSKIAVLIREFTQNIISSVQLIKLAYLSRILPETIYSIPSVFIRIAPYIEPLTISVQDYLIRSLTAFREFPESISLTLQLIKQIEFIRELSQPISPYIELIRSYVGGRTIYQPVSVSAELFKKILQILEQPISTSVSLVTIRIPYIEPLTIQVSTQLIKHVSFIRTIVLKPVINVVLKVVSPVKFVYQLITPPYSLFSIFENLEFIIVFFGSILGLTLFGMAIVWSRRKELYQRPEERW